jgi:methylmalonyl-CoA/ethylmalonyl-CoA epimerase
MKLEKLDHIGIAVESLGASLPIWEGVLGLPCHGTEEVAEQKVKTSFFPVGDTEVELLESTDPEGPIGKFIANKGQGVHHLAFRVDDIDAALEELKAKGVRLIDEKPRYGAGGARIAFIHPKATGGVLIELSERK